MAKGIILGKPGETVPGGITQSDLARAAEAVANAPMTDSGIVIPPHVADEQAQAQRVGPNRAQRRAWERQERKRRSREKRMTPEQQEALQGVREATDRLSPADLERARALMHGARSRDELIERLQAEGE